MLLIAGIAFSAIPLSNRTWIKVGSLQSNIDAWGAQRGWNANGSYYEGLLWPAWYARSDNFVITRQFMAARNFTNTSGGVDAYKSVKFSTGASSNQLVPQVLTQSARYPYCEITVDGTSQYIDDYIDGNYHDGNEIPADRLVTNVIRTGLGIEMTRKVYAFSQQYNDNYFITEYTFKNTGNVDDDDEIELSSTINDFYFGMMSRYCTSREAYYVTNLRQASWGAHQWVHHTPMSENPELPYFYTWLGQAQTSDITIDYDNIGVPFLPAEGSIDEARLRSPQFVGMAVLHTDESATSTINDKSKVRMGWHIGDSVPPEGADERVWTFLTDNFEGLVTVDQAQDDYANHQIADRKSPYSVIKDKGSAGTNSYMTFGPYDIPFGESVKIVVCDAASGLDRKKAVEVGKIWYKAYNGNSVNLTLPDGTIAQDTPIEGSTFIADAKDIYKNTWHYTGKDSIIKTFQRARENYESGYSIEMPPPPPLSFTITPQPDMVSLEWSNNSESDPDFEGYRIYRAMLEPDSFYTPIFDCNVTEGNVINKYDDVELLRGINYYYYIVAYNSNGLESGRAYTQTTIPASLKKPLRDVSDDDILLSDIATMYKNGEISDEERIDAVMGMARIVPNPYNIKNQSITFGTGSDKDKLMFYNIPENCDIRIFTERGDLVDVIHHVTAEGMSPVADEAWYSSTDSRQVVKSGVYIAHILVTKDIAETTTGLPLLKEGESIVKKFIIIR